MAQMNRTEAEAYCKRKGHLYALKTIKEQKDENERTIKKVMKQGAIWGDPVAEVQW